MGGIWNHRHHFTRVCVYWNFSLTQPTLFRKVEAEGFHSIECLSHERALLSVLNLVDMNISYLA